MSTIGRFLQAKEPLFDHALHQLELISHQKGIDVKLAAEIAEKAADHAKRLGVAADASGPELYDALIQQAAANDDHLARAIGGTDPSDATAMMPLIIAAAKAARIPKDGWFLKEAKAKELLRRMPPMAVMDRLGYHLVSALLDHEDISELFLALRFAEDPEWLNAFNKQFLDLTPADFEPRRIRLVALDTAKWGNIAEAYVVQRTHNVIASKEMGAIGILPTSEPTAPGLTLTLLTLLLHYYNELRLYSSFFKLMQSKQNFGAIVSDTLIADPSHVKITDGAHVHWRIIQRYFSTSAGNTHPEILEPHLQPEDLHWRRAEEVLFEIDPDLKFWDGLDYVGALKGTTHEPVSFNLIDVARAYAKNVPYAERYLSGFRESLWNELFAKYLGESVLEEQLRSKLADLVIKPEVLTRHE